MNGAVVWRAAALQTAAVAIVSVALALALSHEFFEDWGWLAGPAAWALCAAITARALRLDLARTLLGAAVAGVPSLIAVIVGAHWLGAAVAIGLFALWCGRFGVARGGDPAWT